MIPLPRGQPRSVLGLTWCMLYFCVSWHWGQPRSVLGLTWCMLYFCVSWHWGSCQSCQCLGLLMFAQMLMQVIGHGHCVNTVRQPALQVNSGRKIPCLSSKSDLHQQCAEHDVQPIELHPDSSSVNEPVFKDHPFSKTKFLLTSWLVSFTGPTVLKREVNRYYVLHIVTW